MLKDKYIIFAGINDIEVIKRIVHDLDSVRENDCDFEYLIYLLNGFCFVVCGNQHEAAVKIIEDIFKYEIKEAEVTDTHPLQYSLEERFGWH